MIGFDRTARFEDEDGVVQVEFEIAFRDDAGVRHPKPLLTIVAIRRDDRPANLSAEREAEIIGQLADGIGAEVVAE